MGIPDHFSEILEIVQFLGLKILKFFDADPGPGFGIRNLFDPGPGIRDKHPKNQKAVKMLR